VRWRFYILCLLLLGASSIALWAQSAMKTQPIYFPKKVFADLHTSRYLDGKLQETWFGSQLFGLNEPSLLGRAQNDEPVYRFTLLPSFGHPVVVRVMIHQDGTATVITRVGKGAGGYGPKGLLVERSIDANREKVEALKHLIISSKVWELPTEPNQQSGTDGTEWLFEAADSSRYHVVDRWEGSNLREVGLFFLKELGQPEPEADLSHSIE